MRYRKILGFFLFLVILVIALVGCGGGNSKTVSSTTGTVTGTLSLNSSETFSATSKSLTTQSLVSTMSLPVVKLKTDWTKSATVSGEKIMKFHSGMSEEEVSQLVTKLGGTVKQKIYGYDDTYLIQIDSQIFSAASVARNSNIEYSHDNHTLHIMTTATPNDTYYSTYQTWNYELLNLPAAWAIQKGNSNVIVAVVDSGVSLSHPDLKANLVSGYDFVGNDSNPSDNEYYNKGNENSHGTHVAGTISAVTNNGVGVAGVAWNVKIMPVRVIDETGYATDSALAQGIRWAADHGANIINLSLGAEFTSSQATTDFPLTVSALDYAYSKGVTVVAAAGNETHYVDFPANYSHVIAVSAVDYNGAITSYSNYGSEVLVCAPGGDGSSQTDVRSWVISTCYDKLTKENFYVGLCGTSMACPHIAGLAALLYSRGITSPDAITEKLKMGTVHDNNLGYGLPNAYTILNGVTVGVSSAKVFYALADGTMGTETDPKVSGSYTVSSIPVGTVYICAFVDVNGDGNVSNGDYFAYTQVGITAGSTIAQNLTLKTVSITSGKTLSNFIKNGFQ